MLSRYRVSAYVFWFCIGCVWLNADICAQPPATETASPAVLALQPQDRIAIIGNTLADRMQHFGHLESILQSHFPQHALVIRHLGFSGDTLTVRPRSDNFGSPDDWLRRIEADVILACFGYNESFEGEAGLPQFRRQLEAFIDHTCSQQYNGKSAPRLILISPTPCENLQWPHLPDGAQNNRRMALYTAAMADVARDRNVGFVDLFNSTQRLLALTNWDSSPLRNLDGIRRDRFGAKLPDAFRDGTLAFPPVTINGVHLSDFGYASISRIIAAHFILPGTLPPRQAALDAIRTAVLDKNLHWHNIYRATDGYSVFGGRSTLKFVDGQTNFDVMQRELEILNVMVANRDQVIWRLAQGADPATTRPDDSKLPAPLTVKTNKPGPLQQGAHRFLSGEEAIREMTVHSGMQIGLFASEEQFPELVNPVQSAVDPDGRLWVAAWPTYPHWNPLGEMNDKLLILPDDDGDGRADRCITFADGLHNPTGFEFWNGGVLVAMAPDIFFLKDTDGDDVCDVRERIFHGLDSADTHHTANSMVMSPGGRYYFSRGIFHVENFETPWGPTVRFGSSPCGVFEFDPLRFDIRFQFPIGPNPHGDCFDEWGNQFVTDGTGGTGHYVGFPGRGSPQQLYNKRVRPVPATAILDSPHFPEDLQGNLLIANVIGFQGITQYAFEHDGASLHAAEVEPIVYSTDPNFRPSDMEIAGDGSLLILDWHNPLIGHMQHNLRDPSRDQGHGRVYRVTAEGRQTMPVARMRGRPVEEVVAHLAAPALSERYRARLELTGRNPAAATAAAETWAAQWDDDNPAHARHLLEALWVHQQHRIVNQKLLWRLLSSPEPNARAAAVKVLAEWSTPIDSPAVADRAPAIRPEEAVARLLHLAEDQSAMVRAQAVVAAAGIKAKDAPEVVLAAMLRPTDVQLEFNLKEAAALLDLHGYVREQLASGTSLSSAAAAFALKHGSVDDLLKMERTEAVHRAILTREHVPADTLEQALAGLAQLSGQSQMETLFGLIEHLDPKADGNVLNSLTRLLINQPPDQLQQVRDRIVKLATTSASAQARRVAAAAWLNAAADAEAVFAEVGRSPLTLEDVLLAVPLVSVEKSQQAVLQSLVERIPALPGQQGPSAAATPGVRVDFFAPNPPDVALETLQRRSPQSSGTAPNITLDLPILQTRDAFALRFTGHLVIEQPGIYAFFLASDDGSRLYLNDELLIDNDGLHGMRERSGRATLGAGLHPFVLTYFDNGGDDGLRLSWSGPDFDKQVVPETVLVTAPEQTIQELAIRMLMQLPGHEAAKTVLLVSLLRDQQSVDTAWHAVSSIPADVWPQNQTGHLAAAVVSYLAGRPPQERNSVESQRVLGIARALRERLEADGLDRFDQRMAEVVVPLIEIGTVNERMIYDKETIAVQAGRPVEFRLFNSDNMPHNFAIVLPGSLETVGELAESTGRDADAAARQFVPHSDQILTSSALMQPGQAVSVFFQVPQHPGIYPYVCTYPGHWRRMYGALYVVNDLRAYQADPVAYMQDHPLRMQDPLLKYLGRNTDWQLDDLKGDVMHLSHRANNFGVGRQIFRAASCTGCHRLHEEGANLGPDLSRLPAEYSAADVLEHMLEPSKKIDPKYQSSILVLSSGKTLSGLVLEETNDSVKIIDNPASPDRTTVVAKSEIEQRQISPVSIMPKGVLNKLTREEILDLVAYVVAAGNPQNALFRQHAH